MFKTAIDMGFLTVSASILGVCLSASMTAIAGQLQNGTVFFNKPPTLVDATSSSGLAVQSGATYKFTLWVPEDAGEPLQAVTIKGNRMWNNTGFDPNESRAYKTDKMAAEVPVALASIGGTKPANPGEVTVVFDPPIAPGNKVTVVLQPRQTAWEDGIDLFGVTAFPAGQSSQGQFLGYGRLHYYKR